MMAPIRYRAQMGIPTTKLEHILQWLWCWRIEIAISYIVLAVTATVVIEVLR